MKFTSSGNSDKENSRTTAKARFCEQYSFLESLFEQWNNCERTVVLCALLKRMSFSNLKFLQLSIQQNLIQNYGLQSKYHEEERDSNDVTFLNQLANKYKTFARDSTNNCLSNDSLLHNSISFANSSENLDHYQKKQDILTDLLTYLPLLRPQNDEAKSVYMNLIPFFVEDSIQHIVPTDLVQQFFSYLLIHPAITSDDRRSLSHWLKHLQDHISSSITTKQFPLDNSFKFLSVSDLQSPYLTSSTSSLSSASWKTTYGNLHAGSLYTQSKHDVSDWDLHNIQMTQDFCDDLKASSSCTKTSNNTSMVVGTKSQLTQNNQKNTSTRHLCKEKGGMDDLHVSFSKNGTEIFDFEYDDYKSNTHVGFDTISINDYLTVPESSVSCGGSWDSNATIKTRRSNSLTTATSTQSNPCSSVENLATIIQKPRSFSLSGDSLRTNLTSHGSETRLDDITKPNHVRYNSHKVGMSGIGQWLKTLRLHKYVWLFTNLTYEQMLDITEDYLENLGVTKGARHKLVLCIQKLKDRSSLLHQIEKDLLTGVKHPHQVLEDMTTIVTTPMKPVEVYNKDDVATLFFKVLDAIVSIITSKPIYTQQDEDAVNVILWLLERSLHNEAFMAQTNQLKEHKFKLSKIKNQHFSSKGHYNKNSINNGGLNKMRWNNTQKHRSGSSEGLKMHRKNSNNMQSFPNFSSKNNSYLSNNQNSSHVNNNNHYKSSSYPNFTSSNTRVLTNNVLNSALNYNKTDVYSLRPSSGSQEVQSNDIQSVVHVFNDSYRHSISNLISMQQPLIKQSIQPVSVAKPEKIDKKMLTKCGSKSDTSNETNQKNKASSIGDINSRLEFLCLQMTEQAIN